MPTNILLLPLYEVDVETRSNEDARGSFAFEVSDGGEPPAFSALSLAGIDFRMQLRLGSASRVVHLEATAANGRLLAQDNVLSILVDQSEMAGLPAQDFDWDVLAIADGIERRVMFGAWRHRLGVTKP